MNALKNLSVKIIIPCLKTIYFSFLEVHIFSSDDNDSETIRDKSVVWLKVVIPEAHGGSSK